MSTIAKEGREFEIIPRDDHDVLVRVRGRTVRDLFVHALRAAAAYMHPEALTAGAGDKRVVQGIAVQAVDAPSLLVEFMTRILAEADAHGAVFTSAAFRAFGENFLEAELTGVAVEDVATEIRAVSYQDVDIKKNPDTGLLETTLVFES
ncbi:MAG: archease [Patescibacteria group bacterium]